MKYLVGLVLLLLVAAGGTYVVAGRMTPPAITIEKPDKYVGAATPLEIAIASPEAPMMKPLRIVFEQNGKQTTLFSLDEPGKAQIRQEGTETVRISAEIGKQTIPDLQNGPAKHPRRQPDARCVRGIRTVVVDRHPRRRRSGSIGRASR